MSCRHFATCSKQVNHLIDENELFFDCSTHHKWVGIPYSHAAVELIQHDTEGAPCGNRAANVEAVGVIIGHAVRRGRLERIDHVQIVAPALRPVFDRMRTGVRADVVCKPVARGAVRIVGIERPDVVGINIPEELIEARQFLRSRLEH